MNPCVAQGHSDSITSVAFSPDGKQLATGSADHNARIWDLSSGHCSVVLQVRQVINGCSCC